MAFDQKELEINYEQSAEKVKELAKELDELRLTADERSFANRDQSAEDKEKKKAEKMALMMAQYDTVCDNNKTCGRMHPKLPDIAGLHVRTR